MTVPILLNCEQGSDAWRQARCGIPTASQMHRIITPKKLTASAGATKYISELIAEWLLGRPLDGDAGSPWMDRGSEMEAEAVGWYELERGVRTTKVGLVLTADRRAGCSPDRLVGPDGLLEVKCPTAAVHVGYLLHGIGVEHRTQVQGQLFLSGRKWIDFESYNPEIEPFLRRYERDEEFVAAFTPIFQAFLARLDNEKANLHGRGIVPKDPDAPRSLSDAEQKLSEQLDEIEGPVDPGELDPDHVLFRKESPGRSAYVEWLEAIEHAATSRDFIDLHGEITDDQRIDNAQREKLYAKIGDRIKRRTQ